MSWTEALSQWPREPVVLVVLALGAFLYLSGARRVAGWPRSRTAFFLAGSAVLVVAIASPVAVYTHALFSVHMVQHLLLTLVAAPLLVLGAPVTLAMRALPPTARRRVATLVHARPVAVVSAPLVAWCAFALVMWVTHFSPLYELALSNAAVHHAEHALYLAAGLLFFWPLAGLDPGARRLSHPMRLLYLLLAVPQQAFLGLAIFSAGEVLYPHYGAPGGALDPLADQALAGVIMWVVGDLLFLGALVAAVIAWMRHDELEAKRTDRRLGLR
jgi:putative membrane protein